MSRTYAVFREDRVMTDENYIRKAENFYDKGKLISYPNKVPVRMIVLKRIAEKFEYGRKYTEKEVNRIIAEQILFSDVALIRRELYQNRFINRLPDCSEYWRE